MYKLVAADVLTQMLARVAIGVVCSILLLAPLLIRHQPGQAVVHLAVNTRQPSKTSITTPRLSSTSPPPPVVVLSTLKPPPPPPTLPAVSESSVAPCSLNYHIDDFEPLVAADGARQEMSCAAPCACGVTYQRAVVLRSEVKERRLFAAFPGGGEVFAIGLPGRMPLQRLALEVLPANHSAASAGWLRLRHGPSGRLLYMVPPRAAAGAWMVRLGAPSEVREQGDLFCVDPHHGLFSHVTRGYVNLRGEVLLRGHGDQQGRAAGRIASSRVCVLRVPASAFAADEAYWSCRMAPHGSPDARAGATPLAPSALSAPHVPLALRSRSAAPPAPLVPQLRVLTYATKATQMLCESLVVALHSQVPLLQTLMPSDARPMPARCLPMPSDSFRVLRAGPQVPLTLLGFGEAYKGNFQKLTGARALVATLPPETLVLFADAYDVLYAGGADGILERWQALNVSSTRILFQAERGCWPDWDMGPLGRDFCLQTYPASPTPYRYVNSGVWMGRAGEAARLFTELVACVIAP